MDSNLIVREKRRTGLLILSWLALWAVAGLWGWISYELFFTKPAGPNFSGEVATRIPLQTPGLFRLAVLGDCRGNTEALEAILEHARQRADAAVILGDIVDYASGIQHRFVNREIFESARGLPVFTGIGNHDLDRADRGDFFRKYFGPDHWWWRFGRNLFLMTNNVEDSRWDEERDWLSQALDRQTRPGDHIFVMMHKPPALSTDPYEHTLSSHKSKELYQMISVHPNATILASHIHELKQYDFHGIPVFISGAAGAPQHLDPPLYGYFLLQCTPEKCRLERIDLGPVSPSDLFIEKIFLLHCYYGELAGIGLAAWLLGRYHWRRRKRPAIAPRQ